MWEYEEGIVMLKKIIILFKTKNKIRASNSHAKEHIIIQLYKDIGLPTNKMIKSVKSERSSKCSKMIDTVNFKRGNYILYNLTCMNFAAIFRPFRSIDVNSGLPVVFSIAALSSKSF